MFKKKRILCFNILNSNTCPYSDKCLYAHSIDTQFVDLQRKRALNLIKSKKDMKLINLIEDKTLKKHLLVLTRLCNDCMNNVCPGGYNCKYGACIKNILICPNDFKKGDCKNKINDNRCINGMHLTHHGLVPLVKQQLLYTFSDDQFLKQNNWATIKKSVSGLRMMKPVMNNIRYENKFNIFEDDSSDSDF